MKTLPQACRVAAALCVTGLMTMGGVSGTSIVLSSAGVQTQPPDGARTLERSESVERTLSPTDEHAYALTLAANEAATVVVEQRGIDVVVSTFGPDGAIATYQNEPRTQGMERADIVATAAGRYTLVVKPVRWTKQPGAYSIRIVDVRPATDDDRRFQESRALIRSGVELWDSGNNIAAGEHFERALAIADAAAAPNRVLAAVISVHLADVHLQHRLFVKAEPLFERARKTFAEERGPDDPMLAYIFSRLAALYVHTGQRAAADRLIQQAIEITEKTLGPEHPQVAQCLEVLGNLRLDADDLDKAQEVYRRALAITEKTVGTDTMQYANVLHGLGQVSLTRRKLADARDLFTRSVEILKRRLGPDNYAVANGYNNLGVVAREMKNYAEAESYYLRSLAIYETIVGHEHPDVASTLSNLAVLYRATGNLRKALETHLQVLDIREKTTTAYSFAILNSLGNIARTEAALGDVDQALAYQRRTDAVIESQLALNLTIGSERQKLIFANTVAERTDRTISLDLGLAAGRPDADRLAALVILQRKGRVFDAMANTLATLRARTSTDAAARSLLDELRDTRTELARAVFNDTPQTSAAERTRSIRTLEARRETIETELSARSAEFRAHALPVTLEAVQAAIPEGAALIEFAAFRPFDPMAESNAEAYGPRHYAVYVIRHSGLPRGNDLGECEPIDRAVAQFRSALRDPNRADVKVLGRALYKRLLQPIGKSLRAGSRLIVSPDGALNLIPFEALVAGDGRYLMEQHPITYLTSGRDLLRIQVGRESRSNAVIVADPLFGEAAPADATPAEAPSQASSRVTSSEKLSEMHFAPLSGTAREADAIKGLVADATVLSGEAASKATLVTLVAPRILHIATHGFFLNAAGNANPLLRSGLALAGANGAADVHANGILTALEASGLNLWGTRLVTLSACETGIGEVRIGEGVYGLRRAMFLAGAETLVMSLWSVSDSVTRAVMTTYYSGLKRGLGRGDALRRAELAMMAQPGRHHPFYWASFIQAGDWRSLGNSGPVAPPSQ